MVCVLVALLCAACGNKRPVATEAELQEQRHAFVLLNNSDYRAQLRHMLLRMEREAAGLGPDKRAVFDILVIHGGGPSGGFAAGVLQGWGEVEDPDFARPIFDLVTGSSSGSLVAPFAFAGDEESYARISAHFRHPPKDWGGTGLFSMWPTRKSILDVSKFEKMVRGVFDSTLTVKIASGRREERLVVILTTNLDVGLAQFWDLGYQIEGLEPDAAATRIQDLILASTALPVALPAREIDGALHADGAIAASMFLGIDFKGFLWLLDHLS